MTSGRALVLLGGRAYRTLRGLSYREVSGRADHRLAAVLYQAVPSFRPTYRIEGKWDMRQTAKFALTLLTGFAIGGGVFQVLQAQGVKKPAYVVAEVAVTDAQGFQAYAAKVPETLKPYNGRIVVRAKPDPKEGAAPQGNIVMLEFDSLADAEKWYSTPPYSELIPERAKTATSRLYIVEGLAQ
jgi:uncharacterized protein (DUF1330 family)